MIVEVLKLIKKFNIPINAQDVLNLIDEDYKREEKLRKDRLETLDNIIFTKKQELLKLNEKIEKIKEFLEE